MSELERPVVGDEMLVVIGRKRRDPVTRELAAHHDVVEVRVTAVARHRVTVATEGWSPWEFDLRTGQAWSERNSLFPYHGPRLYTADGWAEYQRRQAAYAYLKEAGIYLSSLHGTLSVPARERPVELANVLRAFEGLDPIT